MKYKITLVILLLIGCHFNEKEDIETKSKSIVSDINLPFKPRSNIVYRTAEPIHIDGNLDETIWKKTDWTADFVKREESTQPTPKFRTRVKMLWDDIYFYFAAELEETDIWAAMTNRNDPLYRENAFEVFLDPTGDTHNYFEFEINALGTIWDLLLTKPGRDGGHGISQWNLLDYKAQVLIDGTINDPKLKDNKWIIEIALPFEALTEVVPGRDRPESGDQWRVNFLRMNWAFEIINGQYRKKIDDKTNQPAGEYKWTWSPQKISMHIPETWGYIQFSDKIAGQGIDKFIWDQDEKIKWALRQIYYQEKKFHRANGYFTNDLSELNAAIDQKLTNGIEFIPKIKTTMTLFEASVIGFDKQTQWYIDSTGRVWSNGNR